MHHVFIEIPQLSVTKGIVVFQRPLATGIMERPLVPLPRKIDPFGMTELVAHEREVAASAGGQGHQADHLVQGDAAIYRQVLGADVHRRVHFLVHQPENNGFIAHERLVVALGIADGLFIGALVGEFVPDLAHAPLLVRFLLDPFDPMVGDAHGHPEAEADASLDEGRGQTGHAAHVLGDGDGPRMDLPDQEVGQGQIDQGVGIHALVEIIVVTVEVAAQPVVPVEHAGHAVESEAVQVVFRHPVLAVGQEEVPGLVLAVVEAAGAPGGMPALGAFVEIQVLAPVETAQALGLVVHAVRMDDIHDHGDMAPVRLVHQGLELLGRAETRTQGKEIGHLVAEGAVIRMLLQGHDLDDVIAQGGHPGQHIAAELVETGHLPLLRRHADVALVDERMGPAGRAGILPDISLLRIPDLGAEHLGNRILDASRGVRRQALTAAARPFDEEFIQFAMAQEHPVQAQFPRTAAQGRQFIGLCPLPVVAIPDQVDADGIRRPFAKHPGPVRFAVQAEIQVVVEGFAQPSVRRVAVPHGQNGPVSGINGFLVGKQPGVFVINLSHLLPGFRGRSAGISGIRPPVFGNALPGPGCRQTRFGDLPLDPRCVPVPPRRRGNQISSCRTSVTSVSSVPSAKRTRM